MVKSRYISIVVMLIAACCLCANTMVDSTMSIVVDTLPAVQNAAHTPAVQDSDSLPPIFSTMPLSSGVKSFKPTMMAQKQKKNNVAWSPNAQKALWLGVIIPGAGQFYNRQYWKLPIVYGGFMGCAYAISWNGRRYTDYKQAYIDILTATDYTNPEASFIKILPEGYTIESLGGVSNYTNMLNNNQNTYRRNRDLGIIAAIAVYALALIDSYVDAQLFNFDITPDLTFNVLPQINYDSLNQRSAELQLTFNF